MRHLLLQHACATVLHQQPERERERESVRDREREREQQLHHPRVHGEEKDTINTWLHKQDVPDIFVSVLNRTISPFSPLSRA
ncbi:hypothetical protein SRHO_G00263760 [Serrasalmus rhombeus]